MGGGVAKRSSGGRCKVRKEEWEEKERHHETIYERACTRRYDLTFGRLRIRGARSVRGMRYEKDRGVSEARSICVFRTSCCQDKSNYIQRTASWCARVSRCTSLLAQSTVRYRLLRASSPTEHSTLDGTPEVAFEPLKHSTRAIP